MEDGFAVTSEELRGHAARVDELRDRLEAVKSASSAITQDDAAYGLLCGWISAILERRHVRQDQLYAKVENNLRLAAEAVRRTGQDYDDADRSASDRIRQAGRA